MPTRGFILDECHDLGCVLATASSVPFYFCVVVDVVASLVTTAWRARVSAAGNVSVSSVCVDVDVHVDVELCAVWRGSHQSSKGGSIDRSVDRSMKASGDTLACAKVVVVLTYLG